MRTFIHILLTIIAITVAAGTAAAWDEDAAKGITEAQDRMRSALRSGDAESLADLYADGFRLITPFKPVCETREALLKDFQYALDFGLHDFEIMREELLGSGDEIVEIGRVKIYNHRGDLMSHFRFMTLWKKEDGRWRIFRDMSTTL